MSTAKYISLWLLLCIGGCTPIDIPGVDKSLLPEATNQAASPPTFVKVLQEKEHPDFAAAVSRVNLPETTIKEALITAMPFPVTLQVGARVNQQQKLSLRIADQTTVKGFLKHIAAITGYKLIYHPDEKTIQIVALETRSWYLPTLVGRYQTQITVGRDLETDGEEGSDDASQSEDVSISARFANEESVEWDDVVSQAHCLLKTEKCLKGEDAESDGSSLVAYKEQGLITAISTPEKIAILDKWLGHLEQNLNRFVRIQVALVNVRKEDSNKQGIDFEALFDSDGDQIEIEYQNNLTDDSVKQFVIGGTLISGSLSLSSVIDLLKQKTDSELLHQANVTVAAGETAIVKATETFYFASGSEIIPGDSQNEQIVSTNLQQESVGIELAITPRFLKPSSDLMSVRVMPLISRLTGFDAIVSNGQTVSRTPKLESNNFVSHSVLRNGRAVIIGGLTSQSGSLKQNRFPIQMFSSMLAGQAGEFVESELIVIVSAQEVEA